MDIRSLTDAALERLWSGSFQDLGPREQLLVTLWGLEADINNGGFDQYYFNSYGDQAQIAPAALRQIGATQMAALVERANAQFGLGGPSMDQDQRQVDLLQIREAAGPVWEALEQEFWRYPDDIEALLRSHLASSGFAA